MRKLRMGTKIIWGYISVLLISSALMAFLASLLFSINNISLFLADDAIPMMGQAGRLERTLAGVNLNMSSYYYSQDDSFYQAAMALAPELDAIFQDMDGNLADFDSGQKQRLQTSVSELKKQVAAIKTRLTENSADMNALKKAQSGFSEQRQNAFEQISDLYDKVKESIEQANDDGDQTATATMNGYLAHTDGLWDNSEMANVYFWRGQANRDLAMIRQSVESMDLVAQALADFSRTRVSGELRDMLSDLNKTIPASQAALNDFVSLWSQCETNNQALNSLIQQVGASAAELYKQAENLTSTVAADTRGMVSQALTAAFVGLGLMLLVGLACAGLITRSITNSIKKTIGDLMDGAGQVDNNAATLAESSRSLSRGAAENAASLTEISSSLEELQAMTSSNSENAAEANSLMTKSRQAAHNAEESMVSLSAAMEEISGYGGEIGKIIKTIDEIAFQTNLLALNAAVEAARAGEAGAGFAVVAEEVRNLAGRSAEAAQSTAALIDSTIKSIGSGSELLKNTEENFSSMLSGLGKVAELVSDVASASQEQTSGLKSIESAMHEMDTVTQETSSAADESAAAGQSLADQSTKLLETVDELSEMVFGAGQESGGSPKTALPAPAARTKLLS